MCEYVREKEKKATVINTKIYVLFILSKLFIGHEPCDREGVAGGTVAATNHTALRELWQRRGRSAAGHLLFVVVCYEMLDVFHHYRRIYALPV